MPFRLRLFVTLLAIAAIGTIVVCIGQSTLRLSRSEDQQDSEACPPTDSGEPVAEVSRQGLAASCRERADRLRRQLGEPCAVASRPPFVLAGDSPVSVLNGRYAAVIQLTCEILNRRYFRALPDEPIAVLMFSDETAYRHFAERLFFDRHVSRFGYYKPGRRTILVNLAEGEGAIRHELVHALMDFDFPDAPPWIQEGIATLYETVQITGIEPEPRLSRRNSGLFSFVTTGNPLPCATGVSPVLNWQPAQDTSETADVNRIQFLEPVVNWRLAVLQRHFRAGHAADLRRLVILPSLRGSMEAVNYALARYFCMFLYQRGHLENVYQTVRDGAASDPTGQHALMTAFSCSDWQSVDIPFRDWALTL